MRAQSTQAACGPTAVANAVQALGIPHREVNEARVADWCRRASREEHPDVGGAGEGVLIRAVNDQSPRRWGLTAWPETQSDPRAAAALLRGHLVVGNAAVLCVDNHEHWVAAVGYFGSSFLIADPGDNEIVLVYDEDQLLGRWRSVVEPQVHFAVIIRRKRK